MEYFWPRYVSVGERRAKSKRQKDQLRKKGMDIKPIEIQGRTIARSFWGKGWCKHLESFSDYANRLPRGRSYVRHHAVCHLEIQSGRVEAMVSGTDLYKVVIEIKKLEADKWQAIKKKCGGQIGSMLELLRGRLSNEVMGVVTDRENGLFPLPGEITLKCSCPDRAVMCKHVAAVLYGVGSRLDDKPDLLFLLRGVDAEELISAEMALHTGKTAEGADSIAEDQLGDIFDVELEQEPPEQKQPGPESSKAPIKENKKGPALNKENAEAPSWDAKELLEEVAQRAEKTAKKKPGRPENKTAAAKKPGRPRKKSAPKKPGRPRKKASATKKPGRPRKSQTPLPSPAQAKENAKEKTTAEPANKSPTGKSVARLRKKLGLSGPQFAEQLGVSVASVYRWEKTAGKLNLHERTLLAIAKMEKQAKKK